MKQEQIDKLDNLAITDSNEEMLTVSYDTGDNNDTERFVSKAESVFKDNGITTFQITSSCSCGDEDEDWTVNDIHIEYADLDFDVLKKALNELDQI